MDDVLDADAVGRPHLDADTFRQTLAQLGLTQTGFAALLSRLGDGRDRRAILRAVQRAAQAGASTSGEMPVILTLLARERARARRLADALEWRDDGQGRQTAETQGVRLTVSPQSGGRWAVQARHAADGPDGYSPSFPHWRDSLEEAKIRAVLAIDETLDQVEANRAPQ